MTDESNEKPLFIPLAREWFEKFKSGEKRVEYRFHNARWNRRTCRVGRAVTLSLGYSKRERLHGKITDFDHVPFYKLPAAEQAFFLHRACVFDDDVFGYAAITIELDK